MSDRPHPPPVHVLIPTHTTRHLAACLAGLAWQTLPPASVTVSCDTDDPEIGDLLRRTWPAVAARWAGAPALLHVSRARCEGPRLNQVRNNGLRALAQRRRPSPGDVVLVLDGDTVLAPDALAVHAAAAAGGAGVLIAYRVNLSQAQTAGVSAGAVLAAAGAGQAPGAWLSEPSRRALARRQRRYERQWRLRRLGGGPLLKPHKPKALGGHHALTVAALRAVNGYDEEFVGYGYDDDDLTRRLYRLRPRPRVAIVVDRAVAFHLWHPSRAPARPTDAPGYTRFRRRGLPVAAAHGWDNPLPQPPVSVAEIPAAAAALRA